MVGTTYESRRAGTQPAVHRLIRQLGVDSAYLLTGFPLALIGFVVLVAGFSLGIGTLITLAGIPVLTATLFAARGFAELERWRISRVLDLPHIRGTYKRPAPGSGAWRRLFTTLADGQAWLDLLHGVVLFVVATVTWSIAVTRTTSRTGGYSPCWPTSGPEPPRRRPLRGPGTPPRPGSWRSAPRLR
jgi:hypothetical protein